MAHETNAEQQVPHDTEQVHSAIYARSSTAPNPTSISGQLKKCRLAVQTMGWTVMAYLALADEGRSGNTLDGRLGMELLLPEDGRRSTSGSHLKLR